MSSMGELKAHLNAVKQTRQITNAMYLLSTSRMKKAMQNIDFNLAYLNKLRVTIKDILSKAKHNDIHNHFIEQQSEGQTLFIAISSDKGLCGGFNSDVAELTAEKMSEKNDPLLFSVGSIGTSLLSAKGLHPAYSKDSMLKVPTLDTAAEVARAIIELYRTHEVNEAFVVYTQYENAAVQKPVCRRLLPLLRRDFTDLEYEYKYTAYPIYEPDVSAVFENLVSHYVTGFMYDVFMQSAASENCARMGAMQSATENADGMIEELSAQINAERQLAITNEITEISAATDVEGAV